MRKGVAQVSLAGESSTQRRAPSGAHPVQAQDLHLWGVREPEGGKYRSNFILD